MEFDFDYDNDHENADNIAADDDNEGGWTWGWGRDCWKARTATNSHHRQVFFNRQTGFLYRTYRFWLTDRQVLIDRQTGFFDPKESESFWFQWRKVFNPMKRKWSFLQPFCNPYISNIHMTWYTSLLSHHHCLKTPSQMDTAPCSYKWMDLVWDTLFLHWVIIM